MGTDRQQVSLDASIRQVTDRELAVRSRLGSLVYFIVFVICIILTPYEKDAPEVAYGCTAAMLALGILRLHIARGFDRIYPVHPRRWRIAFLANQLAIALVLAIMCGGCVILYGLDRTALISIVLTAGLTAGGTITMSPDRFLFRMWLAFTFVPVILSLLVLTDRDGYSIAFLLALYCFFLLASGKRLHTVHNDMVRHSLLFDSRREKLEREVERRKETESALRRSEERMSLVLDAANEGFWDWNVRTGEFYCSPHWLRSLGYTDDEFTGRYEFWEQIVHPDDLDRALTILQEHIDGSRNHFEVENRLRKKDGHYRWNLARGRVVERDEQGQPLRMVGTDTDISDFKRAEEAIRSNEATLTSIFRAAPAGIGISSGRTLLQVNERMCEILGYETEEMIGARSRMMYASDEDYERYGRLHYSEIQAKGTASTEMRWIRRDGRMIDVLVNSAALDPNDRTGAIAFAVMDITDRKRVEQRLKEARRTAMEASRMKSEFLANMSHEIRTPMNGVIGLTQLLLDTDLDREQREYIETIHACGDQLLNLISDILDFSKIEAGMMELESVPFDLTDRISHALKPLRYQANKKGLELVLDIDREVPRVVVGDPGRLQQVLVNLVGNALKFTEQGEIAVRIRKADGEGTPDWIHFEVHDTGVGIPARMQKEIFEAFKQADGSTTRRHGGSGLGLSISHKLVALMGGSLEVRSAPDRGSRFFWSAPYEEILTEKEPGSNEEAESRPVANHRLRILLAEDNRVNRLVATRMLEKDGHTVFAVEDGLAALKALENDRYDIVLMDIQMPVMDGLEAVRRLRIRESGNGIRVPVIALTAHAIKGDEERCLEAGMDAYVPKPIQRDQLLDRIRRLTST